MRHGFVLVELRFKVHRGLVAEGAVEPLPVVKDFDPLEHGSPRLGACRKLTAMHQFPFQALNANQLAGCLSRWTQSVRAVLAGEVVALDGMSVRRALNK